MISKENNILYLHTITHCPMPSFTNNGKIIDASYSMRIGKILNLCGLEIDKEYDFDCYEDFEIIKRISRVKHPNGLIYDDLYYKLKSKNYLKNYLRTKKLKNILK